MGLCIVYTSSATREYSVSWSLNLKSAKRGKGHDLFEPWFFRGVKF